MRLLEEDEPARLRLVAALLGSKQGAGGKAQWGM
jgi:hypothetical protein